MRLHLVHIKMKKVHFNSLVLINTDVNVKRFNAKFRERLLIRKQLYIISYLALD